MPTDTETLTLALALTAGGAVAFAALITGVIALLKSVAATAVTGRERVLSLVLSAVVVVLAMAQGIGDGTITLNIATGFAGFLAWYGIARISNGIHDDIPA